MSMPRPNVSEFVERFDNDETAWFRLSDEEKLELFVAAATRMWSAENELSNRER